MTETTSAGPSRSRADIATGHASRYMQQLCKHFGHKVQAQFDERTGMVVFSIGTCRLSADEAQLTLSLDAPDAAQLLQLQEVVASHLLRFAFREELAIAWQPV